MSDSGGLRYCKAMGVALKERGIVQVSMNMTDFSQTAIHTAFELIRAERGEPHTDQRLAGIFVLPATGILAYQQSVGMRMSEP